MTSYMVLGYFPDLLNSPIEDKGEAAFLLIFSLNSKHNVVNGPFLGQKFEF